MRFHDELTVQWALSSIFPYHTSNLPLRLFSDCTPYSASIRSSLMRRLPFRPFAYIITPSPGIQNLGYRIVLTREGQLTVPIYADASVIPLTEHIWVIRSFSNKLMTQQLSTFTKSLERAEFSQPVYPVIFSILCYRAYSIYVPFVILRDLRANSKIFLARVRFDASTLHHHRNFLNSWWFAEI